MALRRIDWVWNSRRSFRSEAWTELVLAFYDLIYMEITVKRFSLACAGWCERLKLYRR